MPLESMQELKCFQTLLVRSESLLRNAVDTNLTVNHSDHVLQIMSVCNVETTERHTLPFWYQQACKKMSH